MGADWIELDVQQTKDGRVVVSHDTNLYRVSGVDKYIYDLKYDEIKKIDVGSFYGKEFSKERVPLLSDVIFYAKENGIRLNIEIKPTGHETDLEKQVVDMIHEYHFQNLCVVASQSYGSIEKVKEYSDDIMTVYVSGVEYKDYTSFTAADAFSIDANFVTSDLVHQIHAQGKELYVWTINTEEDIQRMIDMNVDNIITDNIELCREVVDYLGE